MRETLEEATQRICNCERDITFFELGAKWQQERSYSEEEVMNIIDSFIDNFDSRKEWFKQFKKK